MGHSYHLNYAHLIFHVDSVEIHTNDMERLHDYLSGILLSRGVKRIAIGGIENHVHILGDFPLNRAVADIVRPTKAASSFWLKGIHNRYQNFAWQAGYAYFSVSPSLYPRVANYIAHQAEHHANMTAEEEYDRLMSKCTPFLPPDPS